MATFVPAISVVIPVYNRAGVVGRAITSVIRQTYRAQEIVVVDDGSYDGSIAAVEAIGDSRIKIIRTGINKGGSFARNIGIDAASGDFIALLDSDDWWLPGKLAKQVELLNRMEDMSNVICYTNLNSVGPYMSYMVNKQLYDVRMPLSEYLLVQCNAMQTSSLLLATEFARTIRFDERLPCFQDWDFVLRAKKSGACFIGTMEALVNKDNTALSGRVSHTASHARVQFWLESAKPDLTKGAKAALFLHQSLPHLVKDDPRRALASLLRTSLSCVPLKLVLIGILKAFLPRTANKIKKNRFVRCILHKQCGRVISIETK